MLSTLWHPVMLHAQPESSNQTRCMDCLVANGAVQLPTNRDISTDRVFTVAHHGSARVSRQIPPMNLSPVRVYNPARRSSMVIYVPVEVLRG